MIYFPQTLMDFGINKGLPVKVIYKYFPEYVRWLILNVDGFSIEIEVFKPLGLPTPFLSDLAIQKECHEVFKNYYNKLYLLEFLKTKKSIPLNIEKKIIEEASLKKDEYFETENMNPNFNVYYALNVLKKLKKEPEEKHFLFGGECITKNAKTKGHVMTEALYKRQQENIEIWQEYAKKLPEDLRGSEEDEIQILIDWEDEISDCIYAMSRDID